MDYVSRFILEDLDIRGAVVHLGVSWRAMQAGRQYDDATRGLLGEMTAVTALIGSNIKAPGKISFQVQGHGAINLMVVDCDEQLHLRGMARAPDDLAHGPVTDMFGDGNLVLAGILERQAAEFGRLALKSDDCDEILTEACRLVREGLGIDLAKVMELQEDIQGLAIDGLLLAISLGKHSPYSFDLVLLVGIG